MGEYFRKFYFPPFFSLSGPSFSIFPFIFFFLLFYEKVMAPKEDEGWEGRLASLPRSSPPFPDGVVDLAQ